MNRRTNAFDTFLAGASAFVAGVLFTRVMAGERGIWSVQDLATVAAVVVLVIRSGASLRALYLAQSEPASPDTSAG
jgi:hypothetical protein